MAGNNKCGTVIPFEIENKEEVEKLMKQFQKETALDKSIEQKIKDIFSFMWERKIFKIESRYTHGIKLVITVEVNNDGADNDK